MAHVPNKTALGNIRGRVLYLETTIRYWPELIRSLPWQSWQGASPNARPETLREMETAAGFEENRAALEKWARKNEIKDLWIWDAAVQTLMNSPAGATPTTWFYVSPDLPIEPLSIVFGNWIPELFPWGEFKKTATKSFSQQLESYRRSRIKIWGANRSSLAPQAKWTVLWQRGLTAGQIRSNHLRSHGGEITPDGISLGIRSFASSIGLSLREGRSGPPRRT